MFPRKMIFQKKKTIVTDSSHFHPDDVCAVAVLHILLGGKYVLTRTRDINVAKNADFLLDFGGEYDPWGGRFDHDQSGGAGKREDASSIRVFRFGLEGIRRKICAAREWLPNP